MLYDFTYLTAKIHNWLFAHCSPFWTMMLEFIIVGVCVLGICVLLAILFVYMERKVAAFMQIRLGPNRVGPKGIFQAVADVLKLVLKEGFSPRTSDKFLFNFAPFIVITVAMLALAPIPFAKGLQMYDINIGVFYISAVSSISVIGILMAGWASNSKYSLLGAMRSGAQIVSYELSAGLSIIIIVALAGSMSLNDIVESQRTGWWIFKGHVPAIIAFVIFIIAGTAELNRAPFDMAEAESELTAGFHTEYTGMRFAMFFMAEYVNMFTVCAIGATLFLGGWMPFHVGHLETFNHIMDFVPPIVWFFGKTFFLIFVIMWFRWTFPRLRIDQLLTLEWKYLMPVSLVNMILVALIVIMGWHF
ncbi:MAG: NADH-quinone oxidoreductase subunit NuoH [Bacteroidetes bacterium]|nr:NADH-quinone oxidoreductase subunit NuoH [Bacteroidota bacterium]